MFLRRRATVIGPTPPGTGVRKPAARDASRKSTSPTRRWPLFFVASGMALIPQSITTAPGFTQSPARAGGGRERERGEGERYMPLID